MKRTLKLLKYVYVIAEITGSGTIARYVGKSDRRTIQVRMDEHENDPNNKENPKVKKLLQDRPNNVLVCVALFNDKDRIADLEHTVATMYGLEHLGEGTLYNEVIPEGNPIKFTIELPF